MRTVLAAHTTMRSSSEPSERHQKPRISGLQFIVAVTVVCAVTIGLIAIVGAAKRHVVGSESNLPGVAANLYAGLDNGLAETLY